jgi:hypothetical protein
MFSDVPHEEHRLVTREESRFSGIRSWHGKLESALGDIPKLTFLVPHELNLPTVRDHIFDAHLKLPRINLYGVLPASTVALLFRY